MKSLLKKVAYFIYVLFLLYSLDVRCQTIVKSKEIPFVRDIKNKNILKITKNVYGNAWIEFKNEVNTTPEEVFVNNKTAFGLNENDQMILVKENTDIFGITHYRYQQYHKDFKVEGGEYIVHSVDNKVIRANGKIVENINISSATITDSTTAIRIALDTISKILNIINFENIAIKHELVITKIGNSEFSNNKNYKLAYKFNIEFTSNQLNFIVYIDAINCEILKMLKINYSIVGCQTGHVLTEYYGDKDFEIYQNFWGSHNLICGGFHTRFWEGSYKDNKNNNDYWGTNSERKSATAHWAAQEASKYFLNVFNRWGPNENGNTVEIYVGGPDKNGSIKYVASTYPSNLPQQIYISAPVDNICSSPVSLDIIGHEYTHCVIYHIQNLGDVDVNSETESNALLESFCDIFGKMTEFYALNYFTNWETGSIVFYNQNHDSYRRSFDNPAKYDDAASYMDANWVNGNGQGGKTKYIWNGVQNHWFYLLSDGGTYNNITVSGIGKEKAALIAYYNLNNYLVKYADYADAKNGSIWAAMDIFGNCSNEVLQTIKAWDAVGVSSATGFGYDLTVDCAQLNFFHNGFIPYFPAQSYTARAINNLTANCDITPNGQPVTFIAGNSITLTDGFKSGDNFIAYIDPCLSIANKVMINHYEDNNEEYGYINNILVQQNNILISDNENNIDNVFENKISIFPNPCNGKFVVNVSLKENERYSIHIFDILGKLIYERKNLIQNQTGINLFPKTKGVYFINIITQPENIFFKRKLIIF